MHVDEAPPDDGEAAPRQTYNFAPGSRGLVYRAAVPDWGAGPRRGEDNAEAPVQDDDNDGQDGAEAEKTTKKSNETTSEKATTAASTDATNQKTKYILQTMKWGLVPSWTKRDPGYGGMLKTINCRSEGLASPGGMWSSMKGRKRCVVICQGFYEWLKKGKEKIPHYTKRKDGQLMCFAGLWDCCDYGGKEVKVYSYTIITTESNKQLNFLHDRMPVILDPGSKEMEMWLDPNRYEWSKELQSCLKPYQGELECYPVDQAVGKVGNNDPSFIVPVNSTANKNNIANFFGGGGGKKAVKGEAKKKELNEEADVKSETNQDNDLADAKPEIKPEEEVQDEEEQKDVKTENIPHTEDNAPLPVAASSSPGKRGVKRERSDDDDEQDTQEPRQMSIEESMDSMEPPTKSAKTDAAGGRKTRSATHNDRGVIRDKKKTAADGSKKITGFFEKK